MFKHKEVERTKIHRSTTKHIHFGTKINWINLAWLCLALLALLGLLCLLCLVWLCLALLCLAWLALLSLLALLCSPVLYYFSKSSLGCWKEAGLRKNAIVHQHLRRPFRVNIAFKNHRLLHKMPNATPANQQTIKTANRQTNKPPNHKQNHQTAKPANQQTSKPMTIETPESRLHDCSLEGAWGHSA